MPEQLVRALSQITADLVRDADIANMLPLITRLGAQVLNAAATALVVVDPRGRVRVLPTTDERPDLTRLLEAHALDGPWTESMSSMDVVVVGHAAADGRWPHVSRAADGAGFAAVCAAPMILGDRAVGSLALFFGEHAEFGPDHRATIQMLADLTTLSLCQNSDDTRAELLARRTLSVFDDRVRYEHAVGMTAGRLNTDPDRAAALLRTHARTHGLSLVTLSRDIIDGTFDWTALEPSS
ncbi:GAF and ANTAR domain-containing protein [Nocardia spumae]|uniref:GAF and ANTAR domain-containing protein n=1 Tax=Nocardia spumae TaxID=2887190 RepID=UPI001D136361|nr:GAF and ANTAR domain-containing protein [Nocardia spumae]